MKQAEFRVDLEALVLISAKQSLCMDYAGFPGTDSASLMFSYSYPWQYPSSLDVPANLSQIFTIGRVNSLITRLFVERYIRVIPNQVKPVEPEHLWRARFDLSPEALSILCRNASASLPMVTHGSIIFDNRLEQPQFSFDKFHSGQNLYPLEPDDLYRSSILSPGDFVLSGAQTEDGQIGLTLANGNRLSVAMPVLNETAKPLGETITHSIPMLPYEIKIGNRTYIEATRN